MRNLFRGLLGAREMGQRINELASKPDDLGSVSGTHTVQGENQFPQLFPNIHICTVARTQYVNAHTHEKYTNVKCNHEKRYLVTLANNFFSFNSCIDQVRNVHKEHSGTHCSTANIHCFF